MIKDKIKVDKIIISKKGEFNFDSVYNNAKAWFDNKQYGFTEKENSLADNTSKEEYKIIWETQRQVNDYMEFNINTLITTKNINKRAKMHKGIIKITSDCFIKLDYHDKWKDSKLQSIMFFIYNNFVIKKKLKEHIVKLNAEFKDYLKTIKTSLNQ